MTEQVEEKDELVQNPEKLLKMYRELQDDVKTLRVENKGLKTEVESANPDAVNKWKQRAVKAEAKARLEEDGIRDADRILKYMKLDGVDFNEDEALTGFDEKLNEVKTDFPELFDKKRRAGGKADIYADGKVDKAKSTTQAQVDAIFA
jgi:predicted nuclease with TOPRIM domain